MKAAGTSWLVVFVVSLAANVALIRGLYLVTMHSRIARVGHVALWFLIGILASQPLLLAVFAVLGPWAVRIQAPAAAIGLIALAFASLLMEQGPFALSIELRMGIAQVFIPIVGTLLILKSRGWQARLPGRTGATPSQYGLRHLFGWMSIVAVLLAVLRYFAPWERYRNMPHLLSHVPDSFQWGLVYSIIVMGNLALALAALIEQRVRRLILIGLSSVVIAWLITIWKFTDVLAFAGKAIPLVINCGILTGSALTLLPLRWLGWRIDRHPASL